MKRTKVYNGRLIFDHLPKTAGQAVNAWLQKELGSGCVSTNLGGGHQELVRRCGGEYSIVSGHLDFCGEGLDPRYQYMTLFRDPVDRVVSHLFFILNNHKADQLTELFAWAEEFVASNGRHLNEGLRPYISDYCINHFISIEKSGATVISGDEKVAKALEFVKKYNVVGLYEELPEFFADVADLIGIPAPEQIERVNVTKSRPSCNTVSSELRERIVELNQMDVQLYEKVIRWKKSQPSRKQRQVLVSPWEKYESVRDRVFTTPCIPEIQATLRGGGEVVFGQLIAFEVDFLLTRQVHELEAGIHIVDENKRWVFGTNSTLQGKIYRDISAGSHRITHHLIADLPAGNYTAGISFAERLPEGKTQELAWYDVLCKFRVQHDVPLPSVGCVCLPSEITLQPSDDSLVVQKPVGSITPADEIEFMHPNGQHKVSVTVSNAGKQLWLGDRFRPVRLSYHWYDQEGAPARCEELRTELPEGGIAPGETVESEMTVQAPEQPGSYELVLTLVQERVRWFEERGFVPCKVEVEIV